MTDDELEQERARALSLILDDESHHKVIVAGPGTGKSYTFQRLIDQTQGPSLAMTFLVALVEDLERALGQDVAYSFHGFAKKLLLSTDVPGVSRAVTYYPPIEQIYEGDLLLFDRAVTDADLQRAFMNRQDLDLVGDVLRSGDYYDVVGHTDSVYRVVDALERDPTLIPRYGQIVVDEYQDFSRLEVDLIECLAKVSPVLIVGDDDQALYGFKHASASFIRDLVSDTRFKPFTLPFCSRCTAVVVAATRAVVAAAQSAGLLQDRVDKPYICYLPEKRAEGERYPTLVHARCSVDSKKTPYMARYIANAIGRIDAEEIAESRAKDYPTVLVIGKKQHTDRVFALLASQGFPNLYMKTRPRHDVAAIDGYQLLRRNDRSRLGWRILLHFDQPSGWHDWVREALTTGAELVDLIDHEYLEQRLAVLALLQRLRASGEDPDDDERDLLERATGLRWADIAVAIGLRERPPVEDQRAVLNAVPDAPSVLFANMMTSKGLEAAHVFLVGMNEGSFPLRNARPTEIEICQLIVALTRARKSVTLLSCNRYGGTLQRGSIFTHWLGDLSEELQVDKQYLDRVDK